MCEYIQYVHFKFERKKDKFMEILSRWCDSNDKFREYIAYEVNVLNETKQILLHSFRPFFSSHAAGERAGDESVHIWSDKQTLNYFIFGGRQSTDWTLVEWKQNDLLLNYFCLYLF